MNKAEEISRLYAIYAKRLNREELNAEEFQPLVLNIAYLEIAKAKRNHLPYDTRKLFNEYTQAALAVIPGYEKEVSDPRYATMYFGFAATAEWDGLWNFLREYFESKLGVSIDNEKRITLRFDSSRHNRYQYGNLVAHSEVLRKVVISLDQNMKNGQFSISESLSNKEGSLVSVTGNKYIYIGTDTDFMFEFDLDSYGNIESFSLVRTDLNLRIDYLE
jgi:hypothetical protein